MKTARELAENVLCECVDLDAFDSLKRDIDKAESLILSDRAEVRRGLCVRCGTIQINLNN